MTEGPAVAEKEHLTRRSRILTCPSPPTIWNRPPLLARAEIASRIAAGQLLVLHPPLVYCVPQSWLRLHPGGDLAILHYIGRDASNEIEGYHTGRTVQERMARWVVGRVEVNDEGWRDMVPPVQIGMWPLPVPRIMVSPALDEDALKAEVEAEKQGAPATTEGFLAADLVDPPYPRDDLLPLTPSYQNHLRLAMRELHERVSLRGLTTPTSFLSGYGPSLVIYIALFLAFVWSYKAASSTLGYVVSAIFLGLFWHQVTFVVHDAGHTGLTGDWTTDRIIGSLISSFLGGLSLSWWCDNHNVHHLVTNSPEHDPDIQHLPFFAISNRFFESIKSTYHKRVLTLDKFARFVLPYQHNSYYIILAFARFNLFVQSYIFLLSNGLPPRASQAFPLRIFELIGMPFFWTWFSLVVRGIPGLGNRTLFVLVSFVVTSPIHVQIVLSHFSQPVSLGSNATPHTELLESFAHRQLRTTMDISCPTHLDFLHGGLHMQVSHHLFPRLPRFRFRAVQPEVEKWVKEQNDLVQHGEWKGIKLKQGEGLVYKKMEFVEANRSVLGVLKDVAGQLRILGEVARKEALGEIEH